MVDEVSGAEAPSRRTRGAAVAVVVLLLAGLAADRWRADQERDRLLTAVETAERTVTASQSSLLSLADYAGPLLTTEDVPAASRQSALVTIARDAARWEPRVRAAGGRLDDTAVLPWHGDLRTARAAYADRLGAWADLLATIDREPSAFLGGSDGDVRRTRAQAVDALVTAGMDPARVRRALGRGTPSAGEAGASPRR